MRGVGLGGRVIANTPWRLVDCWAFTHALSASDFVLGRAA